MVSNRRLSNDLLGPSERRQNQIRTGLKGKFFWISYHIIFCLLILRLLIICVTLRQHALLDSLTGDITKMLDEAHVLVVGCLCWVLRGCTRP